MKEKVILELPSGKRTFYVDDVDDHEDFTGHNLTFLIDDLVDISEESPLLTEINTFNETVIYV